MAQRIVPHLWFDGAAEEAAATYVSLIPGSSIGAVTRYGKAGFGTHGQPEGRAMSVDFALGGTRMVGINGGPVFRPTPAVSYFVTLEEEASVDRVWEGLVEEGGVLMPLDALAGEAIEELLRTGDDDPRAADLNRAQFPGGQELKD